MQLQYQILWFTSKLSDPLKDTFRRESEMWADTETPVSSSLGQKLSRLSIHCALRVADYSVGFIALLICSRHHLSLLRELRALWIFLFVVLLWLPRFTALALGYILGLGGESFAASQNPIFSNPCVSCVLTVISLLLVSSRMPLKGSAF